METEIMSKLFLELSQVCPAITKREKIYLDALRTIVEFKHAYQQQGELDDNALGCVYDMHDAAQRAIDREDF